MPGFDSGFIQVEFESLSTGASNFGLAHANLVSILEQLDTRVRGSLAEWSSQARSVYQQRSDDNQRAANELADMLMKMATHVSRAHEAYTYTEAKNASMWG